jgi:hypothetical protein
MLKTAHETPLRPQPTTGSSEATDISWTIQSRLHQGRSKSLYTAFQAAGSPKSAGSVSMFALRMVLSVL